MGQLFCQDGEHSDQ